MKQLISGVMLLLCFSAVEAGTRFTTGVEYTSGDYGTGIDTATWYVPFSLSHFGETYSLGLTVPFIAVSGSSEVSGVRGSGRGSATTTVTTTNTRTDSGVGDVVAKASVQLLAEGSVQPWLAVTAKVKFGTASAGKNLGTGENDYALQLEMAKGRFDAMLGYNVLGDTDTIDYDNIIYGSLAWTSELNKTWNLRSEYYTEQPALSGGDPVQELSFSFNRELDKKRSLSVYFLKGISDASADWGAGITLSRTL